MPSERLRPVDGSGGVIKAYNTEVRGAQSKTQDNERMAISSKVLEAGVGLERCLSDSVH